MAIANTHRKNTPRKRGDLNRDKYPRARYILRNTEITLWGATALHIGCTVGWVDFQVQIPLNLYPWCIPRKKWRLLRHRRNEVVGDVLTPILYKEIIHLNGADPLLTSIAKSHHSNIRTRQEKTLRANDTPS